MADLAGNPRVDWHVFVVAKLVLNSKVGLSPPRPEKALERAIFRLLLLLLLVLHFPIRPGGD